ncbi:serine/threonine-protein kinase [Herpetosiphon llansteffanensis]|uniref:serine/threonine-protein kinase n=1 Tax=Herpetosiphon llansteffanensis TaxID=2094568 RepID=UPI000D7BA17C|nr:serine/threonine-protein kinase [Herpetosiphon llansteffanensis]
MTDLTNTTLGKYTLGQPLGAGGMGAVYRSIHPQLGRAVAIKIILGNATEDARQRFLREAQVAVQLSHSNIVRVFDVDEDKGMPFIVMELIEGPSLGDELRQGRMPLEKVLKITTELADALEYAHSQGILHRDIKPANVLIRPNGSAVLVDLGLARLANSESQEHQLTQSGMIIGTLSYMAPEQIQAQQLDARTDIYALGVLLFQMVTGRLPFEGDTPQIMFGHVYTQPPSPSTTGAFLPPALDNLIMAMMAKAPQQRPPSMAEVARVLRSIMHNAATPGGYANPAGPAVVRPQQPMPANYASYPGQANYNAGHPSQPSYGNYSNQPSQGSAHPSQPSYGGMPPTGNLHTQPQHGSIPPANPVLISQPAKRGISPWFWLALLSVFIIGGLGIYTINSAFKKQSPRNPGVVAQIPNVTVAAPEPNPRGNKGPTITPYKKPEPTVKPAPDPANQFTISNVGKREAGSTTLIYGMVTNNTDIGKSAVKIEATFLANDKEVEFETGYSVLGVLGPGERAPWILVLNDAPEYQTVNYEIFGMDNSYASPIDYRDLRVDDVEIKPDGLFYEATGKITNTGKKRTKTLMIYLVTYNDKDEILGVDTIMPGNSSLSPDATARFEASVLFSPEKYKIARHETFVRGLTE